MEHVLLSCVDLTMKLPGRTLFEDFRLTINRNDRIGIIGANGNGKSTLMRILAGEIEPDRGEVVKTSGSKIAYLPQIDVFPDASAEKIVQKALALRIHDDDLRNQECLKWLGIGGSIDPDIEASSLSGGLRKRLAIITALAGEPDLILLDEPTNHLDIPAILWLEETLRNISCAFLVVTHDREFLERSVKSIIEIDTRYEKGLFRSNGGYTRFLEQRSQAIDLQKKREESLANKMRTEEAWLSRGPKARTTKAQYRIDEAACLAEELRVVKSRNDERLRSDFKFVDNVGQRKLLLRCNGLTMSRAGRLLFENLNLAIMRGMRLGLLGMNGSGKTTLLELLAGLRKPDQGTVEWADGIRIAYFSQNRIFDDPEISLRRAFAPETDRILIADESIHVVSWAKRFGFTPEQLDTPLRLLSGGERARVFISGIIRERADLLFLDEPTNDLDIQTLEILEESLESFKGAMVLVSHDRAFLDRVATSILGFDGSGGVSAYADYQQWLEIQKKPQAGENKTLQERPSAKVRKKLSYRDRRELDGIEDAIGKVETRLADCENALAAPEISCDANALHKLTIERDELQTALDTLFRRWQELEDLRNELDLKDPRAPL